MNSFTLIVIYYYVNNIAIYKMTCMDYDTYVLIIYIGHIYTKKCTTQPNHELSMHIVYIYT